MAATWSGFSPRAKRSHIFLYNISIPMAYNSQLNRGLSERAFHTLARVAFKLEIQEIHFFFFLPSFFYFFFLSKIRRWSKRPIFFFLQGRVNNSLHDIQYQSFPFFSIPEASFSFLFFSSSKEEKRGEKTREKKRETQLRNFFFTIREGSSTSL